MFETFLNAIFISVMISVHSHNPVVIREDRVYRYVGNDTDRPLLSDQPIEARDDRESNFAQKNDDRDNIPESLLIQMKNIRNASDFIAHFLMADNSHENKDIHLGYLERGYSSNHSENELDVNEQRKQLTKLPHIGVPAGCVPEMKIIELKPNNSHSELYFPECVRISRCSGCCPSQRLHCVPISTSFEDISVIRVKYSPIEKRLKFEGFKVFRIERHDKCSCDCIQKASQCSPNQIYSESECRCLCPNASAADECQKGYNKFWDQNQCQCRCKSVPFCSTGLAFNETTCRCEADRNEVSAQSSKDSLPHRYGIRKSIDGELETQHNKDLDIFKNKGINPDIDEDYHNSNP